jgi:DNA-binding transcriptional ArsR family regulator
MSLRAQAKRLTSEDRLDGILHALSDRTRRKLLKRLTRGAATVGELTQPIALTRMAVSKHLKVLEEARLITRTIDGRVHYCALRSEPLREVQAWLDGYRTFWTDKLESLARFAEDGGDRDG